MARVRLNWQWERYPEAEASVREVISEYPEFSIAKEDLAAILLEYGQKRNVPQKIADSKSLYKALYDKIGDEADDIYIGSGLAEAVAFSKNPSPSEIAIAEKAVLLSIANSRNAVDDPYAFYAAAVLFHKKGEMQAAVNYLSDAIKTERRRSENPYVFDYARLVEYEKLMLRWTEIDAKQ